MTILDRFKLDGQVALVTGAGSGIGLAFAQALAEAGADVACVDINQDTAEQAAETVRGIGRRAISVRADVTSEDETIAMTKETAEQLGSLDVVFANAGIVEQGAPFLEYSTEAWHRTIDVNLTGVYLTAKAAASIMIPQGRGKIIPTASIYGIVGDTIVGVYGYTAAKGGVVELTKTLAAHLADTGVTVNSIAPAFTRTGLGEGLLREDVQDPEVLAAHAEIVRRTPLGRWAQPEDLQGIAVFLASSASDYATGYTFAIDGGWLAV